ncbi:hypothetical protein HanOQP8_Chr03g0104071 [Helianthus annuus]|nr:hypothetical protein HanOQP8_Chr03g0104071 [Helianthus annuus]
MESMVSSRVPPDIPPDLGLGGGISGSEGLLSSECSAAASVVSNENKVKELEDLSMGEVVVVPTVVSTVSRGFQFSDSGIAYWIVLFEVDLLFLKGMLGENWVFRMFNEKLELGCSDFRVSFKSESDLEGFGVDFSVMLCVEGKGLRGCDFEKVSGLFGSVQEILAGVVQLCGIQSESGDSRDGRLVLKFPQLEVDVNAFELNNNAKFVLLNKRKKRPVKNEGVQVKTCKVLWGTDNFFKKPVKCSEERYSEVLPDGATACELASDLNMNKRIGIDKEVIKRSGRSNMNSNQGQQFKFATSVLDLKFSPGSSDGKLKSEIPVFSGLNDADKGVKRVMSHPNRWRNHQGMALSETDCPEVSTTTINTIQLNDTSHTVSQIIQSIITDNN